MWPAPETAGSGSCCPGGSARAGVSPERHELAEEGSTSCLPFRWCGLDGGEFRMGTGVSGFPGDGEGPVRRVRLGAFSICAYAVTNVQFAEFIRATGYVTDAERFNWSFVFHSLLPADLKARVRRVPRETPWWYPVPHAYWAQPEGAGSTVLDRLDHPVVHVSWNDAQAYCRWSGTRLPTEAEWEFAARGGLDQKLYPWGDELTPGGEHRCNIWQGQFPVLNTADDGYAATAPVHAFAPNGYGLFQVAGNVWEWCADWFSPEYHRVTEAIDPLFKDETGSRSMRGGSFLCHASYCNRYRVAARSANAPASTSSNVGFRVAGSSNVQGPWASSTG